MLENFITFLLSRAQKIRSKKLSVLIHNSDTHPNVQSCTVSVHFAEIIDKERLSFHESPQKTKVWESDLMIKKMQNISGPRDFVACQIYFSLFCLFFFTNHFFTLGTYQWPYWSFWVGLDYLICLSVRVYVIAFNSLSAYRSAAGRRDKGRNNRTGKTDRIEAWCNRGRTY